MTQGIWVILGAPPVPVFMLDEPPVAATIELIPVEQRVGLPFRDDELEPTVAETDSVMVVGAAVVAELPVAQR